MHDLTYIDPHRRAEILRRIEAIERFNANPGRASAEAEAAAINLSPSAFYTLVKAWNVSRDPTKIPGIRRQSRGSVIDAAARKLIEKIAQELPTGRYSAIIEEAKIRANAAAIALPSDNVIREEIRRLRCGHFPPLPQGVTHVLDTCALNVPISSNSRAPVRAMLTAVIRIDGPRIAGAELGTKRFDPRDAAAAVTRAMAAGSLRAGDNILIDRPATKGWDRLVHAICAEGLVVTGARVALTKALADAGPLRIRGNGRAIAGACGRYVAGYQVRIGTRTGAAVLKRNATPIALPEARGLVLRRLGLRSDHEPAFMELLEKLLPSA